MALGATERVLQPHYMKLEILIQVTTDDDVKSTMTGDQLCRRTYVVCAAIIDLKLNGPAR